MNLQLSKLLTRTNGIILLVIVLATTLKILTNQRETLIPYELAYTLPPTGILKAVNATPNSRNGPCPSQRNMMP